MAAQGNQRNCFLSIYLLTVAVISTTASAPSTSPGPLQTDQSVDKITASTEVPNSAGAEDRRIITIYVDGHTPIISNGTEPCGRDIASACPTIKAASVLVQQSTDDYLTEAEVTIELIGHPVNECAVPTGTLPIYFSPERISKLTIQSNDHAGCTKATVLMPNKKSAINSFKLGVLNIKGVRFTTYHTAIAPNVARDCHVLSNTMDFSGNVTISECEFNILPECSAILIPYEMSGSALKSIQLLGNVFTHIVRASNDSAHTDYHIREKQSMVEIDSHTFTTITILNCSFDSCQATGIPGKISTRALKIQLHQSSNPFSSSPPAEASRNSITIQSCSFTYISADVVLSIDQYLSPVDSYLADVLLDSVHFSHNRYGRHLLKANNTKSFLCSECHFENNTSVEPGSATIRLENGFDAHFLFENVTLVNAWRHKDEQNQLQSLFKLRNGQIILQGVSTIV